MFWFNQLNYFENDSPPKLKVLQVRMTGGTGKKGLSRAVPVGQCNMQRPLKGGTLGCMQRTGGRGY